MVSTDTPLKSFTIIWITDVKEQKPTKFLVPGGKYFWKYQKVLFLNQFYLIFI